jgi:hypothetical protein
MFIPDTDFFRIPDPRSNNNKKEEGEKFVVLPYLFAVINFTESKIILFLIRYRTKFELIDKELKYFFTQQLLLSS